MGIPHRGFEVRVPSDLGNHPDVNALAYQTSTSRVTQVVPPNVGNLRSQDGSPPDTRNLENGLLVLSYTLGIL